MTIQEAGFLLINKLRTIYPDGEASRISDLLMEKITGAPKTERMLYKNESLSPEEERELTASLERLLRHEPLQYVTGEAWFCGYKFYVDRNVLIPRPETEELVEWIVSNLRFPLESLRVLDIGTGSGCIAVSLKRRIRKAEVWAIDSSGAALEVARRNADTLGTAVQFRRIDFLDRETWPELPAFDIIVSNPPYIPEADQSTLAPNVLKYEPGRALFVPDEDPLVFYRAIAEFGLSHLQKGGQIYVEINEAAGNAVLSLFHAAGYSAEGRKDMQGKDRMMRMMPK